MGVGRGAADPQQELLGRHRVGRRRVRHALPVWGVWNDDDQRFMFSCAPNAHARPATFAANPRVVVHRSTTPSSAISVEGDASPHHRSGAHRHVGRALRRQVRQRGTRGPRRLRALRTRCSRSSRRSRSRSSSARKSSPPAPPAGASPDAGPGPGRARYHATGGTSRAQPGPLGAISRHGRQISRPTHRTGGVSWRRARTSPCTGLLRRARRGRRPRRWPWSSGRGTGCRDRRPT